MSKEPKTKLSEGMIKKGGINKPPQTEKPEIKPTGQGTKPVITGSDKNSKGKK